MPPLSPTSLPCSFPLPPMIEVYELGLARLTFLPSAMTNTVPPMPRCNRSPVKRARSAAHAQNHHNRRESAHLIDSTIAILSSLRAIDALSRQCTQAFLPNKN